MVVVAMAVLVFTATASVLTGLRAAPAAFAGGDGFVISESAAPTIFSSQVDMDMASLLDSMPNITGTSPEVFAFSSFSGVSFVVRGVDLAMFNSTGPSFRHLTLASSFDPRVSTVVGVRLLDRLGLDLPCTVPLVGSYSSRVEFVEVVGSFETGTAFDDELLVPLDTARYLSGMPVDRASIIRVGTSEPEWLADLLSPRSARFALFDLSTSKAMVVPGQSFDVSVGVRNWGAVPGSATVTFSVLGTTLASAEVELDASAEATVTVPLALSQLGTHTVQASVTGDFPVVLTATVTVVEPYLSITCPSRVILGSDFDVLVTDQSGSPVEGASVMFLSQSASTDADGWTTLSAEQAGTADVIASSPGYTEAARAVEVVDASMYPDEFLPYVTSFTLLPATVKESEDASGTVLVENRGNVSGTFQLAVLVDSRAYATIEVVLDRLASRTVSFTVSDLGVGTHTVQVASFSHGLTVDPWFSDNPDLVQLVIRYGGSNGLTSASSVPIYQAAKISEGNVAVAVFAIGAISALLATLAVVSVFSKEVHEGRRRLGILRTIGASSSAVRRLVFPQALGSGLAGAAVGAVLGVASALALAGSGVFMVFGHRLELSLDPALLASVLLGAVLISVSSALVSAELAVRETIVSSIKRLPNEGPPPVDVDELLGDA